MVHIRTGQEYLTVRFRYCRQDHTIKCEYLVSGATGKIEKGDGHFRWRTNESLKRNAEGVNLHFNYAASASPTEQRIRCGVHVLTLSLESPWSVGVIVQAPAGPAAEYAITHETHFGKTTADDAALRWMRIDRAPYTLITKRLSWLSILFTPPNARAAKILFEPSQELIKNYPDQAVGYALCGLYYAANKDYTKAIESLNTAIKCDDTVIESYLMRSGFLEEAGDLDAAQRDLDHMINIEPNAGDVYAHRGRFQLTHNMYREALDDYGAAIQITPDNPHFYRRKAEILATCATVGLRDGRGAVVHALKACELTKWKDNASLEALAAAYAEAGDFTAAAETETKAHDAAKKYKDMAESRRRKKLYLANKTFSEAPAEKTKSSAEKTKLR